MRPLKVLAIDGHAQLFPTRSGHGRAYCRCGWASEEMETATARREAHRFHKLEIWKREMGT